MEIFTKFLSTFGVVNTSKMRVLLSKTEVHSLLGDHYDKIINVFDAAFHRMQQRIEEDLADGLCTPRPRNIAENMNRYLESYARIEFNNDDLLRPIDKGERFWLTIDDNLVFSLKKLDRSFKTKNILTNQSACITNQAQVPIFPDGTCYLVLGYLFNRTRTGYEGIYIVCNDSTGKMLWNYDITQEVRLETVLPLIYEPETNISVQIEELLKLKGDKKVKKGDVG